MAKVKNSQRKLHQLTPYDRQRRVLLLRKMQRDRMMSKAGRKFKQLKDAIPSNPAARGRKRKRTTVDENLHEVDGLFQQMSISPRHSCSPSTMVEDLCKRFQRCSIKRRYGAPPRKKKGSDTNHTFRTLPLRNGLIFGCKQDGINETYSRENKKLKILK